MSMIILPLALLVLEFARKWLSLLMADNFTIKREIDPGLAVLHKSGPADGIVSK